MCPLNKKRAATAGTFDGVHAGHRRVLAFLRDEAGARGLIPAVITFDRHPLSLIAPERVPSLLSLPEEQQSLLEKEGVEVIRVPFDEPTRAMTTAQWMRKLRDEFGVNLIVAGHDNTFGSDCRAMTPARHEELGRALGLEVVVAPVVPEVSSSAVRRDLASGDVEKARQRLGRPYALSGTVGHGQEFGRKIGFPTANIVPDPRKAIPAPGVYAAVATLPGGESLPAMVNIGHRPTIGRQLPLTIEAHLAGFSGDLYGKTVTLHFLTRLRDEIKFNSPEALARQLRDDLESTLRVCSEEIDSPSSGAEK